MQEACCRASLAGLEEGSRTQSRTRETWWVGHSTVDDSGEQNHPGEVTPSVHPLEYVPLLLTFSQEVPLTEIVPHGPLSLELAPSNRRIDCFDVSRWNDSTILTRVDGPRGD